MKYFLAILACIGVFLVFLLVSVLMGWKSGGGLIPQLILYASMAAVWRVITKKKYKQVENDEK